MARACERDSAVHVGGIRMHMAVYGREKHVLCGVTVMDFVSRNILGIVVQALASTRAWAAEQGLLLRAEHGSPSGDGLVLAGGCIHNALQPVPQRLSGAQADADIFTPELNLAVAADGTPLDYQFGLSVEMAMFPYLFPFGVGAFMGGTTLVKYLAYCAKCLFSVWTLCKPYLLLMYVLHQSARLQEQNTEAVLESVHLDYKSQHPNASDEDAICHILKDKLPATLPNTPAWHRSNLQDLLCMVDRFGMPSFFLTLTTDKVSATCWPEVESLEQKLQDFCAGFTWQDTPAENAFITHKRMQSFMTDVLKAGRGAVQAGGALGCITNWVAVRHRGASEACLPDEAHFRWRCAGAPIADLQPIRVKHCKRNVESMGKNCQLHIARQQPDGSAFPTRTQNFPVGVQQFLSLVLAQVHPELLQHGYRRHGRMRSKKLFHAISTVHVAD
ncbi:hypothetical protein VOLCADRAFT_85990 [Volvox carteri f. nagariensis]|uniref:Helitron helicase-like domain-containing protein n=1 Tax=Volvox carteri f. nagariensis TaxID=3068 RepID=D8THJ0_VOLCA|nr:uncharacterized protein VOLCADRAFT_85990 [Volvox carteri f. nagariensis]EFJ52720.1 hypothetical protein VOLCADRAFT_85990 [Volvox carteri f. nagariensis]|eukprot:XP_002945725.1 hypothetical protein VOLCADRAFT_85990 [Volvox carteri f. nagariensis]